MIPSAVILGLSGPCLLPEEAAVFREVQPFGFILFARNVDSPDQMRRLTADLRDAVGRDAPVLIDQEGGRVQRMRAPHWAEWPDAAQEVARVAARGGDVSQALFLRSALIGAELASVGVDVNCAPVLDVAGPQTHPFLAPRCFGDHPDDVARYGRAVVDGLAHAGVLAVMKHLPGHGCAGADSHHALPEVTDPVETLIARDFAPFRALSDVGMAMANHICYRRIDPQPTTFSARVVGLIRTEIGFDGLLMTDDLAMSALNGSQPDRAARAIAAGMDLALNCHSPPPEAAATAAAAGQMSARAQTRAARALSQRHPAPDPAEIADLRRAYQAIIG